MLKKMLTGLRVGSLTSKATLGELVLFGSDHPWAGEGLASLVLLRLESNQGLDQQARAQISRDNALSLFPRFAAA